AHEPAPADELARYADAGRLWVIAIDDVPVGYAVVDIVDGSAHLMQISVHPEAGQRGLGTILLQHVCGWARDQGYAEITLTTFANLAWNAPFYAKNGFRVMSEDELGPGLRAVRDEETALGLDPELRVCMSAALGR